MTDSKKYEKQFYNALRDIFIGAKVEGDSGYVNLMRIKSRYYEEGVFPQLHQDITAGLKPFPDFGEELFDKLYTFFQRYFSESGSIYFRYTALHQNIYEKVYTDDRDVILFWKTHMLYYVKTDRIFNSMAVEVDGVKFYFNAGSMELKKSNEKRDVVYTFRKVQPGDGTLVFDVSYSERGKITKVDEILKALKQAGTRLDDEILNRAFRVFEKQSEVDFFINKDARAFLREQFDLWLYQYLFAGQNVWGEERLKQLQVLKDIAYKIIDFISQFEDELVKIWNKPKFVRNSHYVLTLDHILNATPVIASSASVIASSSNVIASPARVIANPAGAKQSTGEGDKIASDTERPRNDLLHRLLAHPNMPQQVQEWRDLGMLKDDFRLEMLTEVDLTGFPLHPQYRYLPVDTKYFPDLELDILALFDDLDASLDGWLVHSENYQALISIVTKYYQKCQSIYIDPPYNTDASEIIYTNNYKHSSWITLIENRLSASKDLLTEEGIICITIDHVELSNLKPLMDSVFDQNFKGLVSIKNNPSGRSTVKGFSIANEFGLFFSKNQSSPIGYVPRTDEQLAQYNETDEKGSFQWRSFLRSGGMNDFRVARPRLHYPLFIKGEQVRIPKMLWDKGTNSWLIQEKPAGNEIILWPITQKGIECTWRLGVETLKNRIDELKVMTNQDNGVYLQVKFRMGDEGVLPKTIWDDPKYNATSNGTSLLRDIFGISQLFSFPKSVYAIEESIRVCNASQDDIILDYFAGSGTTAHAVMNLNRVDGGKRKYILVEMGEHFNTVILPRVKKVAFSDQWKDGKAKGGTGMSHFVKYYDLEQYEDVLRRAHYADGDLFYTAREDPYHSYVFLRDLKLLDAVDIDTEQNKAHFHPERLYPDIDLAETLSQRRGKWIKHITAEYVEFQDGEKMSLTDPDWATIKPLVWWQ